jgi:phosphoglucosamine mutase
LSGYTLEPALVSGLTSAGMHVYTLGPLPTNGLAMLTKSMKANMGIMITASHNPHHDNGLKLFGPDGMKLSDKIEKKIENLIDKNIKKNLSNPEKLGRVKRLESGTKDYLKILKKNFSKEFNLRGLRIVIDCANGAGYKAGPELLRSLGAKVISIGINPNGLNINNNCGSTYPNKIKFAVKKNNAHLGISLDGDADRIIMCDEKGNIIDGDQIIAALATRWKNKKMLKGGVVGTLMSNYGLEKFFKSEKIKFIRANVGDRYVKEKMKKNNFNLGGEQSGHIILGKFATTGDGLLVALEVLFAIRKGKKASDFFNKFQKTPQILKNIAVKDKEIIKNIEVKKSIKIAEKLIKGQGRILVRKSGTESKIRVMAESNNKELLNNCINIISKRIK